jgi:hypothetical protein
MPDNNRPEKRRDEDPELAAASRESDQDLDVDEEDFDEDDEGFEDDEAEEMEE